MLRLLKKRTKISNKELAMELKMHPSNVSQHLKVLKQLNLVKESDRLKDNTVLMALDTKTVNRLEEGLKFLFE